MRIAFKEWAIVVDALTRGEQIIILRKGGIHEGRGGFQVEHPRFWLFPTLFHQQRESVIPSAQARYDALQLPGAEKVRIEAFCEVVAWRNLDSLDAAQDLGGQHIWTDEVIGERFKWGRQKNIFALAVRVFRITKPVELPMVPGYGGCKSWIELEREISADGAAKVLDDASFEKRLKQFQISTSS